jgi:hypothetical protein
LIHDFNCGPLGSGKLKDGLQITLKKALKKASTAPCPADMDEWHIKADEFQKHWVSLKVRVQPGCLTSLASLTGFLKSAFDLHSAVIT